MPITGNYKVVGHTRINDGTSSDLSQLLATHPGWLLSAQAFSMSSAAPAYLFMFDTTAAVTTASTPFWQGVIPFSNFIEGTTRVAQGAGVVADMAGGITLNNGLAYAISSAGTVAALSTVPASMIKVNLQYVTSSCL